MYKKIFKLLVLGFTVNLSTLYAQPVLEKDYSFVMEIPSVVSMGSSPAHLYTLSESEGMAVFRAQPDTLQWLYTSTGMQQRGHLLSADIRFAYLYGNSRRLTVLEPTSVLGVYSSTQLPARPLATQRIDQTLYLALGDQGLGKLSLQTPSSVDSTVENIAPPEVQGQSIVDLQASPDQLFVLSAQQQLFQFSYEDEEVSLARQFNLPEPLNRIFLINQSLFGSDERGNIYEVSSSGELAHFGNIKEEVIRIKSWQDWLIIQGNSKRLWSSYQNRRPELWKKDPQAGNYFTVTKGNLWVSEYDQISRITTSDASSATADAPGENNNVDSQSLALQDIPNITFPQSKPLLLPLLLKEDLPASEVKFTYQSSEIDDAEIRGQSFYWHTSSDDVGSHRVKIIATTTGGETDSISFSIDISSFNAPPRFAPIRPVTIPMGEEFNLSVSAIDPDGINDDLIRFLGVDMPDGASIDETTGEFTWTPNARQSGDNHFRVIATDQFGAASSVDITINVVENQRRRNSGD